LRLVSGRIRKLCAGEFEGRGRHALQDWIVGLEPGFRVFSGGRHFFRMI
jgi:hypothetical protein